MKFDFSALLTIVQSNPAAAGPIASVIAQAVMRDPGLVQDAIALQAGGLSPASFLVAHQQAVGQVAMTLIAAIDADPKLLGDLLAAAGVR